MAADAAEDLISVVSDPVGDVQNKYPAYLDLTRATVSLQGQRFQFSVDLAGTVPADPGTDSSLPADLDHWGWEYGLDTDPTTAPVGYPFPDGTANPMEFYLGVDWNSTGSFGLGTGFVGLLVDRRPLLTGGQAIVIPVKFSIQDTVVTLVVEADALGKPATFGWVSFSHVSKYAHPTKHNIPLVDVAPSDFSLVSWPQ
jgi:hypothetical protein